MQTDRSLAALVRDFQRDGYVIISDFFAAEQMHALDCIISEHYGDHPEFGHSDEFLGLSRTDVVPWFPQEDGVTAFDSIDKDPRLRELTASLLGDGWINNYCMVMFSKAGSQGQAWHQDCPPEHRRQFNLNRLVYTRDICAETGGELVIVPGSHRHGLLPPGDPTGELAHEQVLCPTRGTLVLIHGHAWHRVLPINESHRFSINYRAAPAGAANDLTDVCVYRNMRYRFSTGEVIETRVAP